MWRKFCEKEGKKKEKKIASTRVTPIFFRTSFFFFFLYTICTYIIFRRKIDYGYNYWTQFFWKSNQRYC